MTSKEPPAGAPTAKRPGFEPRPLPKRFYTSAAAVADGGRFRIELDGRPARTPRKHELAVPYAAVAQLLAAEWASQATHIDPATMPLTRLVCTALDAVTGQEAATGAEIVKYAGSDLLCYRADGPAGLIARQATLWDPVLRSAERDLGARLLLAEGLMPITQPAAALERIAAAVAPYPALPLAALHVLTTLTGSTLLALAVARGAMTLEQAWTAAHVDEDWQIQQWGEDSEAVARRALRLKEAGAAAAVLASARA